MTVLDLQEQQHGSSQAHIPTCWSLLYIYVYIYLHVSICPNFLDPTSVSCCPKCCQLQSQASCEQGIRGGFPHRSYLDPELMANSCRTPRTPTAQKSNCFTYPRNSGPRSQCAMTCLEAKVLSRLEEKEKVLELFGFVGMPTPEMVC